MRIAILGRGSGPPFGEQKNGEHERVGDDETANPHLFPWLNLSAGSIVVPQAL
jgi:hypothetical protein